jgi:protein-tyrosine-phosphatase
MTAGHRQAILAVAPESEGKVFLLKSFGVAQCTADIDDPVGQSLEVYRRVRDEIDAALPDLILYMMDQGD